MKHVILTRAWSDHRATLGMLKIVNYQHDPIFTLENPLRETNYDSRIPARDYLCSPFSGEKYKNVYEVVGVPERTAILIHPGNSAADTLGCILVGLSCGVKDNEPWVADSRLAFAHLRRIIGDEDFLIKIIDEIANC